MMINFIKSLFTKKKSRKIVTGIPDRPLTDDEFNEVRFNKQKKMNDILDKVSKKGIESLSISEKNFLDNYGN
jgi:hypothetical protein